jgi:uncharacterized protein YsxB (DUF464 family)
MTKFVLYKNKEHFIGYEVSGHSTVDADDTQGKLVCSAVSSAVIMTANTLSDVLGAEVDVKVEDGYLKVTVKNPDDKSDLIIGGLELHMNALADEYKGNIKITDGGLH